MPRTARKESFTGYYHLIVRGIGKQIIFEHDKDYGYYISLMRKYSEETGVSICAYCLMDNHVHFLVYDNSKEVSQFMKKLNVAYAGYFNSKYSRTGHLFQDRFLSEVVDSEAYLITVFRYILNNPAKANICPASEYLWNSYRAYRNPESFVDTSALAGMIGTWEQYAQFISLENSDTCMEYYTQRESDEHAMNVLRHTLNLKSGSGNEIRNYEISVRNEAIRKLKNAGLTSAQIQRLTGIGRGVIQRI